jgi:serine/threonine protein kinase
MHLQNPVPDPREINPNIPDNFVKILLRALEKDPEMRYTSVRAMMKDISAALRMISRDKSNSPDDLFMTIPVDGDDTTLHGEPVPTKKAAVTNESASRKQSAQPSWDKGNRPEPFPKSVDGNAKKQNDLPVDNKELTIFQKTAIWFENAQEKLTWKQKAGFGLITIIVILALSVFGLNFVVGLFSGGNSVDESSNQQTQTHTQAPKVDTSKSEKKEMIPVKNYVGQWQGKLRVEQVDSLKKNGYKIEVSDSLCTNKNTTGTLEHGQIARQEPTGQVEKGGTVKVYVYVEGNRCRY